MPAVSPARSRSLVWPPLIRGRLIKRYNRFLADVILDSGPTVTAHCPNSGRMTSCNRPGQPVFLSYQDDPKRKLKYRWELIEMPTSLVGVNTMVPNRLVAHAIRSRQVPAFEAYPDVSSEVTVSAHTRLDLKLAASGLPDCFIEIKNCTLVDGDRAMFPDAPTVRGRKHLGALTALKAGGMRAVIFFLIQRADARFFTPADEIDPDYGRLLRKAVKQGVEIMAYDTDIDLQRIRLGSPLACRL